MLISFLKNECVTEMRCMLFPWIITINTLKLNQYIMYPNPSLLKIIDFPRLLTFPKEHIMLHIDAHFKACNDQQLTRFKTKRHKRLRKQQHKNSRLKTSEPIFQKNYNYCINILHIRPVQTAVTAPI